MKQLLLGLALLAALAASAPDLVHAQSASKTAVFPFELIDTSLEADSGALATEEHRRLKMIDAELHKLIEADGRYALIDLASLAAEIEKAVPLYKCNGCDVRLGRGVGAETVITGTVQKVSNLILNLNLYVRDMASEKLTAVMSVDIRGNTDESWTRGIRYLAKNRLFKKTSP